MKGASDFKKACPKH